MTNSPTPAKGKRKRRSYTRIDPSAVMSDDRFTLVWPWLTTSAMKALTPHAEGRSFKDKSSATKRVRKTAGLVASTVIDPDHPWEHASHIYRFYKPTAEHIDYINMAQRMKGIVDGVIDAGLLPSDDDRHLSVGGPWELYIDRQTPRIEIVFTRTNPPEVQEVSA